MSKSKKKQAEEQNAYNSPVTVAAHQDYSQLPVWAKALVTAFVAGIAIFLAIGTAAAFLLADWQKKLTDPAQIATSWNAIVEHEPLPQGFTLRSGISLLGITSVDMEYEPTHQKLSFVKLRSNKSAEDVLNEEISQGRTSPSFTQTEVTRGVEAVAGEQMPYVIRQLKQGNTDCGQELFGSIKPKNCTFAIGIKSSTNSNIDMAAIKQVLATIKGFGNAESNKAAGAAPGNSSDNSH